MLPMAQVSKCLQNVLQAYKLKGNSLYSAPRLNGPRINGHPA